MLCFLSIFFIITGYCRLSPLGDDTPLGLLHEAVFHGHTRQPSLFGVHTILCIYFHTLGWFGSLCV